MIKVTVEHVAQLRKILLLGIFLPGSQIPNESLVGKVPLIRAGAPLKAAVLLWRRRRRRRGRCIWPKEGKKTSTGRLSASVTLRYGL